MKTLYLKDGTEIKRDGVDARDYVRAGFATYDKPEIVIQQEIVIDSTADRESVQIEVGKQIRRGRKPKGDNNGL